jgi:hypothetical protein
MRVPSGSQTHKNTLFSLVDMRGPSHVTDILTRELHRCPTWHNSSKQVVTELATRPASPQSAATLLGVIQRPLEDPRRFSRSFCLRSRRRNRRGPFLYEGSTCAYTPRQCKTKDPVFTITTRKSDDLTYFASHCHSQHHFARDRHRLATMTTEAFRGQGRPWHEICF